MLMQTGEVSEVQGAPTPAPKSSRRVFRHAPIWIGLAMTALALLIALDRGGSHAGMTTAGGLCALVLFLIGGVFALGRAMLALHRTVSPEETPARDRARFAAVVLGNLLLAGFSLLGMLVAWAATVGFSRGRQLRRFGRVLLPPVRPDAQWSTAAVTVAWPGEAPLGLADQWRENGRTEHASVAAFARLTLDLMALGAPPALVVAANQDALDEIRHTEICFSLAQRLDGRRVSPGPFPAAQHAATLPRPRLLALARLAVDSLVDGALHEGVSARIIARLAQRCGDSGIRDALREIAADEGRHSAHGWAVVAWCLAEGGRPVAEALRGALRALPADMRSTLPEGARDGAWERWGIHGHALESEEYAAALAHLRQRVRDLTADAGRSAA
jgi:hypothetical protein